MGYSARFLTPFWVAVQFLTRVPVPGNLQFSEATQAHSLLYYPLVGLLLGVLLGHLPLPAETALLNSAFLVTAWVVVTGGLHLDGLADSADAWVGGQGNAVRTLQLMKDVASGPIGVAAIVLVLLLKVAALYELEVQNRLELLLLSPLAGRTSALLLMMTTGYVRPGGLGAKMVAQLPHRAALAVVLAVVAGVGIFFAAEGIALIVLMFAIVLMARQALVRRIGGITGDTIGAVIEFTETAAIVSLAWWPLG